MTERVTLRWGVKEWTSIITLVALFMGAALQVREDVLGRLDIVRVELVAIRTKLELFMQQQSQSEQRQDVLIERIGEKQQNVRERLQSMEDEHKRAMQREVQ